MDINEIYGVYEKLGILADAPLKDDASDRRYSSFGVYVEDGFDFSTHT
ncbi:MAG: hypothetical protein NC299_18055 [Lachnospiraceae bacterium]|nr:hypothetical protein [Lachnospiraceae bacterium]